MFSLHKILIPVDFSARCIAAARNAAPLLARHFQSDVTLLHVLSDYSQMASTELSPVLATDLMAAGKAHAKQYLESFLSEELHDLQVKRVLVKGDPAQQIVEYARAEGSGLILMPTHGYGPFRKLLLGSVTAKVLHDASSPVLTGVHLDEESGGDVMGLKHVLCAIDLKAHNEVTLRWAKDLATAFHSRLTLVHVVSSFDPRVGARSFSSDWQESVFHAATAEIERLQRKMSTQAKLHLEMGDVPRTVCLAAKDLKADLLVMGRGSTTHEKGRLPSDAYSIVRQSPCPVVGV